MKKLLLYSFALLATFATFSCTDEDEASYEASSDRLMTPVFRTNRTISKGGSDPFLCQVVGRNAMQLYWSQVKGAKGYQIKASYEQSIANSPENWDDQTFVLILLVQLLQSCELGRKTTLAGCVHHQQYLTLKL